MSDPNFWQGMSEGWRALIEDYKRLSDSWVKMYEKEVAEHAETRAKLKALESGK